MSRGRRRRIPPPGKVRIEGKVFFEGPPAGLVNDAPFFVPGYRAKRIVRRSRGDGTADVTIEVEAIEPGED